MAGSFDSKKAGNEEMPLLACSNRGKLDLRSSQSFHGNTEKNAILEEIGYLLFTEAATGKVLKEGGTNSLKIRTRRISPVKFRSYQAGFLPIFN